MAEQIKMSDIRAQFPMYADMPDEQLLTGLRKKFYSDIPMKDFVSRIDFDTQRKALQTEAAQASGPFLSGVGQAFTNLARGAGQAVGLVSREDIKDSRKLDQGLSATTGGKLGNLAGNVAALAPSALIPGAGAYAGAAGIGALTGLLAPSESTGETVRNTAIGAAAGPAGVAIGRGAAALWQGGKALVDPFTKAGQERLAARTLQQFASDPKAAAVAAGRATELVPGSQPTLAQATGDAGLAQLERTLMNNQAGMTELAARQAAQRAARLEAVRGLAGTAAQREAAVAAREAATKPLYEKATAATYQVDDVLGELMARPAVKSAISRAQALAANQGRGAPVSAATKAEPGPFILSESGVPLVDLGKAAKPATITGQGLQDLKMALDDLLSNPLAGIGKNEANAIKSARAQLIEWMDKANPAFAAARTTFADKSTPINTMDVAQELMRRLEPALARYGANTKEHASAYAMALEAAKDTVKKSTGINKPMEQVIDKKAADLLERVAQDLGRRAKAEDLGRAVGSNTAQNLAAQNLLRRTLGPAGLPQSWAESNVLQTFLAPYTGAARLGGAEQAVMDRLTRAALDPKDAAALLLAAQRGDSAAAREVLRYLPALSLSTNRPQ